MAIQFYKMNRGHSLMTKNVLGQLRLPYIYRRETCLSKWDKNQKPNLTITGKLREKENIIFRGAPNFYNLPDDDRELPKKSELKVTVEDLKEYEEKEKRKKQKKKERKQKAPSIAEIRERLKIIAKYHKKEVEQSMPCPYPLCGPAGESDSESDSETKDQKSKRAEESDKKPLTYEEKTGTTKKRKITSLQSKIKATPKLKSKRGKNK
jgi:hypothetical protein